MGNQRMSLEKQDPTHYASMKVEITDIKLEEDITKSADCSPPAYESNCPRAKSLQKTWHFLMPDFVPAPKCTCGGFVCATRSKAVHAPPAYTACTEPGTTSPNPVRRLITNMDIASVKMARRVGL